MKNNKTIFLISLLGLLILNNANAQLFVKNNSSNKVNFCIGWYSETKKCFVTKGWFVIEPNETAKPGVTFTSNDDHFYYYAYSTNAVWKGEYKLLTRPTAFNISFADKQETKNDNPDYEWKIFKRKEVKFAPNEEKTFTLTLTGNDKEKMEAEAKAKMDSLFNAASQGGTIAMDSVVSDNSNGFSLYNKYGYTSEDFSGGFDLYTNGKDKYKIEYGGGTKAGCTVSFSADGFYSNATKELVFTSDGCEIKFVFTPDKNLKLTSVKGDSCSGFSGASCSFYLVTYKRDTK